MKSRFLERKISALLVEKRFADARRLLLSAKEKAQQANDVDALYYILSELVELYGAWDPPLWKDAEAVSAERERLKPSAYSVLQTGMILHSGLRDQVAAISKLEQAIALARKEADDRTLYTSVSLLGEAYLADGNEVQALRLLDEIERMIATKAKVVVGDETAFLEALKSRQLAGERVRRLASELATICRDRAFRDRLRSLARPAP